jgi:hypothetical protein
VVTAVRYDFASAEFRRRLRVAWHELAATPDILRQVGGELVAEHPSHGDNYTSDYPRGYGAGMLQAARLLEGPLQRLLAALPVCPHEKPVTVWCEHCG